MAGQATMSAANANLTARVQFGISGNPAGPGDLAVKGIGWRRVGTGAIELLAHDGTTLTATTSSFTPTNLISYRYLVESDGSGNVTLYIDSGSGYSSVATSTGGPTGDSSSNPMLVQEMESTGSSGNVVLIVVQHALLVS
jgi:hypothetical protein